MLSAIVVRQLPRGSRIESLSGAGLGATDAPVLDAVWRVAKNISKVTVGDYDGIYDAPTGVLLAIVDNLTYRNGDAYVVGVLEGGVIRYADSRCGGAGAEFIKDGSAWDECPRGIFQSQVAPVRRRNRAIALAVGGLAVMTTIGLVGRAVLTGRT